MPTASTSDVSARELVDVAATLALLTRLRAVGAVRLLHARLDWERLFTSAEPPGAAAPSVAKATLTRDARRRWELARKARRGVTPAFRLAQAIAAKR